MKKITASMLIALMITMMLAPFHAVYAAGEDEEEAIGEPVRELHKVLVDDTAYCFFVSANAVLTPSEIAGMSDSELVMEILSQSGFYMKQSNCLREVHKPITAEAWVRGGGSFTLRDEDIKAIRKASPVSGSPVKLHMDLMVSSQPEQMVEAAPEKPAEETAADQKDETQTDVGKTGTDDQDENKKDTGSTDTTETGKDKTSEESQDSGTGDGSSTGSDNAGEESGDKTDQGKTAEGGAEDGGTGEDRKDETQAQDPKETADKNDPAAAVDAGRQVVRSIAMYTAISRLTSPELLFVVVATEADAAYKEDICTIKVKQPSMPSIDAGAEKEEMLPELRTISMTDRSGGPLEPTLEDGKAYDLEWIEPKKNKAGDTSWLDHVPGGAAGLVAAAVAAAGAGAFIIRKRREEE